jgi:hypothetical protein
MSATIGEMLACADARFAAQGGYKATAHCGDSRVDLILQDVDGAETVVSTAPMTPGVAGEDIAHDLLVAEVGAEAADRYFVITYAD